MTPWKKLKHNMLTFEYSSMTKEWKNNIWYNVLIKHHKTRTPNVFKLTLTTYPSKRKRRDTMVHDLVQAETWTR